ncbi:CCA tRNA nucleotidyltransferase [Methylobacterium currus]|uniref:CCA tRNA nucleotidyltransferase n=1 Tax=Methylobacterium currus TaxID=2051553 RepID=A0A2R4WDT5_9HYPH|nr:CCA tRNA nucleotidyltransferase [Methylobacterium currus]AWB19707.1 CCA tRNA nucleotidyltransferase [Methylobacterium currus]UHC15584.1 CCA tRNA nucleotidyltransferase [Methylobacterium currus]
MSLLLDERALRAVLARPRLARVLDALSAPTEETRLVGGAVRDALLGRPVADIDLATTLLPEAVVARARDAGLKPVPTGIAHGTVTVVVEGEPFEVTTLREDVETDGRRAVVRFGRDFSHDAARRDFTVNALSVTPDGRVHDTVGGLADLAEGRVRFIGEARQRIREDYLRTLRFFRFHARYGAGAPDPEGLAAAIEARDGLAQLSRERVRGELLKLLVAPGAPAVTTILSQTGLLQRLIGGIGDLGRLARLAAAEAQADPVRRLAALAVRSGADAERLREGLRLSNAEHARLSAYAGAEAALHGAPAPLAPADVRRLVAEHGAGAVSDAALVLTGEPRPVLTPDAADALARFAAGAEPVPVLPVTGAALVAAGAPPGRGLGQGLAAARRAWLAEGCPTDAAAKARLRALALASALAAAGGTPEDSGRSPLPKS